MDLLSSVVQCVTGALYFCVKEEPDSSGTRTMGGMPAVSSPVAPGPLTLPQEDGCTQRALRDASRSVSRCAFQYRDVPGFDMPMATTFSAFLSAPIVQAIGQGVAQTRAHRNEAEGQAYAGNRARFNDFEEFRKLLIEYPVPPTAGGRTAPGVTSCWRASIRSPSSE